MEIVRKGQLQFLILILIKLHRQPPALGHKGWPAPLEGRDAAKPCVAQLARSHFLVSVFGAVFSQG